VVSRFTASWNKETKKQSCRSDCCCAKYTKLLSYIYTISTKHFIPLYSTLKPKTGIALPVQWLATGWGSIPGRSKRAFSSLQCPDQLWGPISLLSNWYQGLFPVGKATEHEADHSPLSSTEVKNDGATPPLPHTFPWHGG
jgi:hypothetical protein